MYESTSYTAASLLPLFAGQEHQLAICAVLAGAAQGRVFVDDTREPRRAVISVQHRVFLSGEPDETGIGAMRDLLAATIAPAARARGDYAFGLYYAPAWHERMADLLPTLPHNPMDRQYYVMRQIEQIGALHERLHAGLRLADVDASLLARTELIHHARLAEEMCSERSSVDDFLAHSFGVCLLDGDTLAGWCLSEYNCDGHCEIGIEVVEEYQRRGLGTLLARALGAEAARRGIRELGWHCLAGNVASGATARKAGLRLALTYPSTVVWLYTGS